jgi:hypothetical protein
VVRREPVRELGVGEVGDPDPRVGDQQPEDGHLGVERPLIRATFESAQEGANRPNGQPAQRVVASLARSPVSAGPISPRRKVVFGARFR